MPDLIPTLALAPFALAGIIGAWVQVEHRLDRHHPPRPAADIEADLRAARDEYALGEYRVIAVPERTQSES